MQQKSDVGLIEIYNDLIDTVKVLEAIRDDDPKKAISFSDFKNLHTDA